MLIVFLLSCFFLFNDPPTSYIFTLSLHDALPIFAELRAQPGLYIFIPAILLFLYVLFRETYGYFYSSLLLTPGTADRKSTRLNSSHLVISYAVFCLKKKISSVSYV